VQATAQGQSPTDIITRRRRFNDSIRDTSINISRTRRTVEGERMIETIPSSNNSDSNDD